VIRIDTHFRENSFLERLLLGHRGVGVLVDELEDIPSSNICFGKVWRNGKSLTAALSREEKSGQNNEELSLVVCPVRNLARPPPTVSEEYEAFLISDKQFRGRKGGERRLANKLKHIRGTRC